MPALLKLCSFAVSCFGLGHSLALGKQHTFLSSSLGDVAAELQQVAAAAKAKPISAVWAFFMSTLSSAAGLCVLRSQRKADTTLQSLTKDPSASVQATVTAKRIECGWGAWVYVSYTFDTTRSDGVQCRVTAEQSWQNPATVMQVGKEETVLYAPENPGLCYPQRAFLEEPRSYTFWGVALLGAGIVNLFMCNLYMANAHFAILPCGWVVCVGMSVWLGSPWVQDFLDLPPSSDGVVEELASKVN